MKLIHRFLKLALKGDDGVTTVEYAVMLAMILLVAIGAIMNAGNAQKAFWFDSADKIESTTAGGPKL